MEHNHYSSNVINNTTTASYPSHSAISPHHLQNGQNQTLPPLQPHNPAMSMYASHPHTPRTPATPNTPASMGGYAPPPPQPSGRGSYPMMHNPYQHQQSYATSSAMMPQASVSASHPQPIAPAPSPGGRVPPVLRPMPAGGVMPQSGLASPYAQSPMMSQPSILHQENDQPTHVVGSQGRRGILPSAPGRPAAPAPGTAAAKAQIPQKDADGKFPCPHCTKTYLHAKHLKRHMLRHTGDRPYMCVLCRDTFSRSDILKRHFQKCSIRRGNPTGASHLSHPHAHVKKAQQAAAKAAQLGHDGDMMNGMNNVTGNPHMVPFGLIPAADQINHMNDQNQLSRQSSMNRLEDANGEERRNVPAPVMSASQQQQQQQQQYNGNVPTSMSTNINPQLANYNMSQNQNGVPMFNGGSNHNQQSGLDWQTMFSQQGGAQDTHPVPTSTFPNRQQTAVKTEPSLDHSRYVGQPPSNSTNGRFGGFTGGRPTDDATYRHLSNQIINFFYSPGMVSTHHNDMNLYFSAENVRHFLGQYAHFHRHFAILHMPTFDAGKSFTGLLACMCCIGACYSDRLSPSHVRLLTDFLRSALDRDARILSLLNDDSQTGLARRDQDGLEELQALVLLHLLLIWNGTPQQRQAARQVYSRIVLLARKSDLLRVSQGQPFFSALHQPGFNPSTYHPSEFDWYSWIEQEKRNRLMFLIFATDTALGLYFNIAPQLDTMSIQIPLPCDDAAWDGATDARSCAEALGLYGPEAAQIRNVDGTRRAKQPEMHLALNALLHSSYRIQTGTTNLTGKFLLVHGILALIRRAQIEGSSALNYGQTSSFAHSDWIVNTGQDNGSTPGSANNSGRNTPADGSMSPQASQAIRTALDKFKQNWDFDIVNQYPPSSRNPRRQGFSKDAIPFYWLANYLLKNTRAGDLEMESEHRFAQVIHILKAVNSYVRSDGAYRGEELGSVDAIDKDYGATNWTLDMAKLFRPFLDMSESPSITPVNMKTEAA